MLCQSDFYKEIEKRHYSHPTPYHLTHTLLNIDNLPYSPHHVQSIRPLQRVIKYVLQSTPCLINQLFPKTQKVFTKIHTMSYKSALSTKMKNLPYSPRLSINQLRPKKKKNLPYGPRLSINKVLPKKKKNGNTVHTMSYKTTAYKTQKTCTTVHTMSNQSGLCKEIENLYYNLHHIF